jgi:hypothetical protein
MRNIATKDIGLGDGPIINETASHRAQSPA